jgi:hypothetical protein
LKPKFYHIFHKFMSFDPIVSQLNPVYNFTIYSSDFKGNFWNIKIGHGKFQLHCFVLVLDIF